MGVFNNTYIGVYIEIPHIKSSIERKVFRKPSGKISKTRFNPETGEQYKEDILIEQIWIEPDPYVQNSDTLREDTFFMPAYTAEERKSIFLVNDSKESFYGGGSLFNYQLDDMNMKEILEEFKIKYKEYIEYFIKEYQTVEIKFGVINYEH